MKIHRTQQHTETCNTQMREEEEANEQQEEKRRRGRGGGRRGWRCARKTRTPHLGWKKEERSEKRAGRGREIERKSKR